MEAKLKISEIRMVASETAGRSFMARNPTDVERIKVDYEDRLITDEHEIPRESILTSKIIKFHSVIKDLRNPSIACC